MINRPKKRTESLSDRLKERLKELNCFYSISSIVETPDITLEEILQKVVIILPRAWQYPEIACAKIVFNNLEYKTNNYKKSKLALQANMQVFRNKVGLAEVSYLPERFRFDQEPFLKEEKALIEAVAERLGRIIERFEMADDLKESEARYRALFDSANDAIISADENGKIINFNLSAAIIFGYSKNEVIGKPIDILMPAKYQTEHQKGLEQFDVVGDHRLIGKSIELEGKKKNGESFSLELSLSEWQAEDRKYFTGIIRDLTERKKTEAALEDKLEELEAMNNLMVGRELKMIELKQQINSREMNPINAKTKIKDGFLEGISLEEGLIQDLEKDYRLLTNNSDLDDKTKEFIREKLAILKSESQEHEKKLQELYNEK